MQEAEPIGCLDVPVPESRLSGRCLLLMGWALSREAPLSSVTALIDGRPVATAGLGKPRPDVAQEYADLPSAAHCGFAFQAPLAGIVDGWHEVAVRIGAESGTVIELGHRRVFLDREMHLQRQLAVRGILACPQCRGELREGNRELVCTGCQAEVPLVDDVPIFEGGQATFDPSAVSVNPYGAQALSLINEFREGLVLDCGAGYPSEHYANVIQFELFRYPSTDVVGDALRLPFADGVFEGAISQAVLEHVVDPFKYASELHRVLKRGGKVIVDSAFLQPLHAYPHHFFNTTQAGLRQVMQSFEMVEEGVGPHQKPWLMLRWVLSSYLKGLASDEERTALLDMTAREMLDVLKNRESKWPFDSVLSHAEQELAAGVYFLGRKP